MTSENNWFGKVLAARTPRNAGPDVPYGQLSASENRDRVLGVADLDELDAALGELRAADWSAPEDPDGDDDAELAGRELIADRLSDEAGWLRQCSGWLAHLAAAAVLSDRRAERRRRLARPRDWSGPGMPGRPSDTSAARSASGPATPTTRSGHADDHPCHSAHQGRSGNWTP
jgi:hypothetical protein